MILKFFHDSQWTVIDGVARYKLMCIPQEMTYKDIDNYDITCISYPQVLSLDDKVNVHTMNIRLENESAKSIVFDGDCYILSSDGKTIDKVHAINRMNANFIKT